MHVAIAGNIGSGKTTLTTKLSKHYNWEAHYEEVKNNPKTTALGHRWLLKSSKLGSQSSRALPTEVRRGQEKQRKQKRNSKDPFSEYFTSNS